MTKCDRIILQHIANTNGLTNPVICAQQTGYALSTCKRAFSKFISLCWVFRPHSNGPFFFYPSGERALLEITTKTASNFKG